MNRRPGERLLWEGTRNARDLGGYQTADGRTLRWGAIVRADNLGSLSDAGWQDLVAHGIRTVIDLRHEMERRADRPCLRQHAERVHVPIFEERDHATAIAIYRADSVLDAYWTMLDACRSSFAAVMTRIARAPEGGVAIHCQSGKDRTGLVAGLLLDLAGVPRDQIAQDYALTGEYLRPLYEAWARQVADPDDRRILLDRHRVRAETMLGVLDMIERVHGGVEPYLRGSGTRAEEIQAIRMRLLGTG